jgi:hypothetical protein
MVRRRVGSARYSWLIQLDTQDDIGGSMMNLEEAKKVIEQTRSFIGRINAHEVVLDGPFKPVELEAILFIMRNRPAPPE